MIFSQFSFEQGNYLVEKSYKIAGNFLCSQNGEESSFLFSFVETAVVEMLLCMSSLGKRCFMVFSPFDIK